MYKPSPVPFSDFAANFVKSLEIISGAINFLALDLLSHSSPDDSLFKSEKEIFLSFQFQTNNGVNDTNDNNVNNNSLPIAVFPANSKPL
jgi:hypothetical protein